MIFFRINNVELPLIYRLLYLYGEHGHELGEEALVQVLAHLVQHEPVPDTVTN